MISNKTLPPFPNGWYALSLARDLDLSARLFILATPIEAMKIDLRIGLSIKGKPTFRKSTRSWDGSRPACSTVSPPARY
jgi:hypothetical protein